MQSFLANWNSIGLASVTKIAPFKAGDPGQHAWVTMSNALSDPSNKHLEVIAKELSSYTEESIMGKKDGHYLNALVNVGMMKRCEAFLEEWDKEGLKSIGLPHSRHRATTLEIANKLIAPLVNDAAKGGQLHNILWDL